VLPARHDVHIQACNVQGDSVPPNPDVWGGLSSDEQFQMTSQTLQIGQMTHRRLKSHSRKVSCATSRPEGGFAWSLTKSLTSLYLQTTTDTSVASRFDFQYQLLSQQSAAAGPAIKAPSLCWLLQRIDYRKVLEDNGAGKMKIEVQQVCRATCASPSVCCMSRSCDSALITSHIAAPLLAARDSVMDMFSASA